MANSLDINTITVSVSVTRNLGNFNSIKVQADAGGSVKGDLEDAFAEAWAACESQVEQKIAEALED